MNREQVFEIKMKEINNIEQKFLQSMESAISVENNILLGGKLNLSLEKMERIGC